MLEKGRRLHFWCQKVLPLVYDESLSYYELLCKVVKYLNEHTEKINTLIDFYNTILREIQEIVQEMIDNGDFDFIVDEIESIIADTYDPTATYQKDDYCIYEGKLYRALDTTTGDFDASKWVEKIIGDDLTELIKIVNQLKILTVNNKDEINAIKNDLIWELGGIYYATGEDAVNAKLARTNRFLPPYFHMEFPDTLVPQAIFLYDDNNTFKDVIMNPEQMFSMNTANNPNGYKCRISVGLASQENISLNDLSGITYWVTDGIQTQIDELKEITTENTDRINAITNTLVWELGGIYYASGEEAVNPKLARTKKYLPPYFHIEFPNTLSPKAIFLYNELGNYVDYIDSPSNSFSMNAVNNPNGYVCRISVGLVSDEDIALRDLRNVVYWVTDGIQTQIDDLKVETANLDTKTINNSDDINAIQNKIVWGIGGIYYASGEDANNPKLAMTKKFLPPYFHIEFPETLVAKAVFLYNQNGEYETDIMNPGSSFSINTSNNPNGYKCRISVGLVSDEDISLSDLVGITYSVTGGIQTQIDELRQQIAALST